MTRLRHLLEDARQRMLFLPAALSAMAVTAAIALVWVDQQVASETLPRVLQTSVDGGREVLGTVAMGLIAAYTLLLSLLLIAVQLASSQFSPRTVRTWLGDRTLQRGMGLVLATVVFCLLVLYQTRDLEDVDTFEPNLSVLAAILLALASLIAVLRSVDHLADSMRVGSVAKKVMNETLELIERISEEAPLDRPTINPAPQLLPAVPERPPEHVHIVTSKSAGWIQEIRTEAILDACPDGSTVHIPVAVGAFSLSKMPLAWLSTISGDHGDLDEFDRRVQGAISIGDVRTMRQDIGYGITRLVDIALRALSPSLNDPNTAKDIIAHLGEVVLALLAQPEGRRTSIRDGRTVVTADQSHHNYVHAAFDQIRHAGIATPQVLAVLAQTLLTVRNEAERRKLPARLSIIDDVLAEIAEDVTRAGLSRSEQERVLDLIPEALRSTRG